MPPYSAALLIPDPKHPAVDPVKPLSVISPDEGDTKYSQHTGQGRRRLCTATVLVVLLLVGVALGVGMALYNNRQFCTTPEPQRVYTFKVGNRTVAVPMPKKVWDMFVQQQRELDALPKCQLQYEAIKVMDVLQEHPLKELQGGKLLNFNVRVSRCKGRCSNRTWCQPALTRNESFVVKYEDSHGEIHYTKRPALHHIQCQCQKL